MKIRVGITMGDPSGIGPEIIAAALPVIAGPSAVTVIGDAWVFQKASSRCRLPGGLSYDFVEMGNVPRKGFSFGKVRKEYGAASLEYVDFALLLLKRGIIDCLVTCPVSKESVSLGKRGFSGHTEYLSEKSGARATVMMLLNRQLKFGMVTNHLALKEVPSRVSRERIIETSLVTAAALRNNFAVRRPKLVCCGLNPHASDHGLFGKEERSALAPALAVLRKKGILIDGPLPADTACYRAYGGEYDAVIAMYHDQALIPLKLTGAESGVNFTAGLPFVRTSPLHGTAFDIAGKGRASAASLIAAVETARTCCLNLRKA